jgi:predicted PurR-regulated permease PerM
MSRPKYEKSGLYERLTYGAPLAVLLAAGLLIAYEALPALELIAVAMLIALVLRTFVRSLGRLGAGPWLSVIILLAAFGALGAMFWLVLVPNLVREAQTLASQMPGYIDSLANLARDVSFVPDPSELTDQLKSNFSQLINSLPSLATTVSELVGGAVAAVFLALYMSINPRPLVSGALLLVPGAQRKGAERFLDTLEHRLRGWIVGLVIAVLIVGVAVGLGLWIIGVPLALTFGILAGLLELVPYIGQIVAALLPALVALTISPVKALLVVVLFVVVNQVDAHVIQPLVMGREVRLPSAIVIISFLILGELLGLVGVLLAVPTAVILATLIDELASKESSQEAEEAEEEIAPGNFRD